MKFRKKPVVIDAVQWFKEDAPDCGVYYDRDYNEFRIDTLEGFHVVTDGDWIITGIKGERYLCKPDIFKMTYEDADNKPKTIVLCGSSRFVDIMAVCAWIIERDEKAITMGLHLLPEWYCKSNIPDHLAEHEGCAAEMDELHLKKIDLCDEIFVVNFNDYIGESTTREIGYTVRRGKIIRLFTNDPVGKKVMDIINPI